MTSSAYWYCPPPGGTVIGLSLMPVVTSVTFFLLAEGGIKQIEIG